MVEIEVHRRGGQSVAPRRPTLASAQHRRERLELGTALRRVCQRGHAALRGNGAAGRAPLSAARAVLTQVSELPLDVHVVLGIDRGVNPHGHFLGVAQFDDLQFQFRLSFFVRDELLQVEV